MSVDSGSVLVLVTGGRTDRELANRERLEGCARDQGFLRRAVQLTVPERPETDWYSPSEWEWLAERVASRTRAAMDEDWRPELLVINDEPNKDEGPSVAATQYRDCAIDWRVWARRTVLYLATKEECDPSTHFGFYRHPEIRAGDTLGRAKMHVDLRSWYRDHGVAVTSHHIKGSRRSAPSVAHELVLTRAEVPGFMPWFPMVGTLDYGDNRRPIEHREWRLIVAGLAKVSVPWRDSLTQFRGLVLYVDGRHESEVEGQIRSICDLKRAIDEQGTID